MKKVTTDTTSTTDVATIRFNKLPTWRKRVAIAKDVLKHLDAKLMKACSKQRFAVFEKNIPIGEKSAQKVWQNGELGTCEVCALGGLFLSTVNLGNRTTTGQLLDEIYNIGLFIREKHKFSNRLTDFFSPEQLELIERFYENNRGSFIQLCNVSIRENASRFHENYITADERLRAIMENIIENKGTFVPSKLKKISTVK